MDRCSWRGALSCPTHKIWGVPMSISLLTNLPALRIQHHLIQSGETYQRATERIASGRRINNAGDDAAGCAISEGIQSRLKGVMRANQNTLEALSMIQVAEGGMTEFSSIMLRLRELAIQAASDNVGDSERELLEIEASQLRSELERIAETTVYFKNPLLNGSGRTFVFQIGPDNNEQNRIEYASSKVDLRPSALGVDGISLMSVDEARDALDPLDEAMKRLATARAEVGAIQTRMHSISAHLTTEAEALTSAYSTIVDADIAEETSIAARARIQLEAGTAILAQANLMPELALRLIEK